MKILKHKGSCKNCNKHPSTHYLDSAVNIFTAVDSSRIYSGTHPFIHHDRISAGNPADESALAAAGRIEEGLTTGPK